MQAAHYSHLFDLNGQQFCDSLQILFYLCSCLHKSIQFEQCLQCFKLITLFYSYLTLPEKQSSSAVTWASSRCHVFLKGCLRGTLQIVCIHHIFHTFFYLFIYFFASASPFTNLITSFIVKWGLFFTFVILLSAIPACSYHQV